MDDRRVEYMPIAAIEPAPRNPKAHAVEAIAKSVDRFGLAELPLIDERTGRLVAGHGRLDDLIARRRDGEPPPAGVRVGPGGDGDWLVPVIRGWASTSDEDAEAYLVASNRLSDLGGWDDEGLHDLLSDLAEQDAALLAVTGYTEDDMAGLLGPEPERTVLPDAGPGDSRDRSSTPPREPVAALGDMWALGNHRVYCGDATNPEHVDQLLAEFDTPPGLVHTDPPYGIAVVKADGTIGEGRNRDHINRGRVGGQVGNRTGPGTVIPSGVYAPVAGDDTTEAAADAFRLATALLPEAVQVWWGGNHFAGSAGLPDSRCWLVWDKVNGTTDFADCELAWTNHPGSVRMFKHMWNGMLRESEKATKRQHPTQKPVALAEWAFGVVDKRAERRLVLDLFAGAGFTLIAAESTGRACAAMELSPAYVDVICRRWQEMTGRKPERITDTGREPVDFTE